eukprot:CAMPEP_0185276674 /NCGR_PEP_ID=MMETSP1359-20130426/56702_1 /TAXON_ID=552665 /ORGANISM="Bigelowiella longifila, Strain CCMP242" /LENGTH=45 /DNA_ID= /DNA_START= /DNA_END= /DNA_ORIENTATION=
MDSVSVVPSFMSDFESKPLGFLVSLSLLQESTFESKSGRLAASFS